LADYNYVLDKIQTRADPSYIIEDMREIAAANNREAARLEQLHSHNNQQQQQIEALEAQIENVSCTAPKDQN